MAAKGDDRSIVTSSTVRYADKVSMRMGAVLCNQSNCKGIPVFQGSFQYHSYAEDKAIPRYTVTVKDYVGL